MHEVDRNSVEKNRSSICPSIIEGKAENKALETENYALKVHSGGLRRRESSFWNPVTCAFTESNPFTIDM